ncbi:hypothetical protein KY290_021490 [Solanum tuberosum]|uniref:Uncharacterized protein n=1 Tax=Solanum tuberosum TaxID=4113 RepID=A0ABQ7V1R4_SOLTU|nr:hypothetical protein KY289_020649 [Solanum tuberosum]KAH0695145.1 hypothetical protein KY285_022242 [Solanum tuberosum]KAH0757997.1 hypothetical protein KY290_021490 [Solanum tuberosum]
MSKETFPPAVTSAKKLYTTQYSSWWERSYGMFLEDNFDVMVEKVGSKFVTLLEDKVKISRTLSKVKTPLSPQHQINGPFKKQAKLARINVGRGKGLNHMGLKGGSFIIEPYSPHRVSRQFGFNQDILRYLENDIRAESLDEGLGYWRICISHATMSKATFPPAVTSAKKLYTTQYSSWWERSYGMFLEDNFDVMVEKVGSKFVTLLEDKVKISRTLSKVKTPLSPQHQINGPFKKQAKLARINVGRGKGLNHMGLKLLI